ncbi:hypothetical protein SAMN05421741_12512 [Paenimyroides ummariense]|uniref:Uncharacterized protein n=1 Tax=Paenimyroides ummariense TaxID=913024 RepID=A0A1I5F690_9FLAO|nr:hypothetical protein [Paenimyroides ummariense]SFO19257.1 hypothetical protein SAMN05421741_12512 [Paenimyroides ummariense]
MANVSFFTEEGSITSNQSATEAFGPLPDSGNSENYNLENRFVISADAPAYAITKGLLIAIANSENVNLLNLILLPINSVTAGMPIKFFIYRGIRKTSLINSNNTIPVADGTWAPDNILKIIKDLQDKKNIEDSTPGVVATSDSLGYQFSNLPDTTYLEKLYYNNGEGFQPLIVNSGCQIGKFNGGTNLAGITVAMEFIGKAPKLSIANKGTHVFSIQKVDLNNPSLNPKEQMELAFKNRFEKEEILSCIDLAAFYGACINQKIRISGLSDTTPLQRFYGKDIVYVDIRDDYGFSFNHFFKFQDEVQYTVLPSGGSGTPTNFTVTDYYQTWPILRVKGMQYNTAKDYLWLKLPLYKLKLDSPFYLCSFTGYFYSVYEKSTQNYGLIANDTEKTTINFDDTEPIRFWNWRHNDNSLGANYIFIKVSYPPEPSAQEVSRELRDLFRVNIESFFSDTVLTDGEFGVKNYDSINAPITRDSSTGQVYTSVIGIVYDKEHVTLYTYRENIIYSESEVDEYFSYPIFKTGLYTKEYAIEDYDLAGVTNPNIGFLSLWRNRQIIDNQTIRKLTVNNGDDVATEVLTLNLDGDFLESDDVVNGLEVITLTRSEFAYLQNVQAGDFPGHPNFIRSGETSIKTEDTYSLTEIKLTLGVPAVLEDVPSGALYVGIEDSPVSIVHNGNPIKFTAIDFL